MPPTTFPSHQVPGRPTCPYYAQAELEHARAMEATSRVVTAAIRAGDRKAMLDELHKHQHVSTTMGNARQSYIAILRQSNHQRQGHPLL
jgi:hypothetical protein